MDIYQFKDKITLLELKMVHTNKNKNERIEWARNIALKHIGRKIYSLEKYEGEWWSKIMPLSLLKSGVWLYIFWKKIIIAWFGGALLKSKLVYAKLYNDSYCLYIYMDR